MKRFEEVNINITSLSSKLQTVLVTVQNFKDGVESMNKWCEQTRKTFERLTTVSFDIYILQQQIREIKVGGRSKSIVFHSWHPSYLTHQDFSASLEFCVFILRFDFIFIEMIKKSSLSLN